MGAVERLSYLLYRTTTNHGLLLLNKRMPRYHFGFQSLHPLLISKCGGKLNATGGTVRFD